MTADSTSNPLMSALWKCARRAPGEGVTLTDEEVRALLSRALEMKPEHRKAPRQRAPRLRVERQAEAAPVVEAPRKHVSPLALTNELLKNGGRR